MFFKAIAIILFLATFAMSTIEARSSKLARANPLVVKMMQQNVEVVDPSLDNVECGQHHTCDNGCCHHNISQGGWWCCADSQAPFICGASEDACEG